MCQLGEGQRGRAMKDILIVLMSLHAVIDGEAQPPF